jgi:hypothetical protein
MKTQCGPKIVAHPCHTATIFSEDSIGDLLQVDLQCHIKETNYIFFVFKDPPIFNILKQISF